jgi:hypothetical protein
VDLYEWGYLIAETEDAVSLSMEWIPANPKNVTEPGGKPGRFRLHIPVVNIIERRNFDVNALLTAKPPRTKRKK